ncbi:MAG: CoA-binding protein, partial [Tenuifilaceae bacterium]|nr:CoA-binding protein [Tenuifilaceae bacterium]
PNETEIDGLKCYQSIIQLPDTIDAAYIVKRKELAIDLAHEIANKGIKKIWIHVINVMLSILRIFAKSTELP